MKTAGVLVLCAAAWARGLDEQLSAEVPGESPLLQALEVPDNTSSAARAKKSSGYYSLPQPAVEVLPHSCAYHQPYGAPMSPYPGQATAILSLGHAGAKAASPLLLRTAGQPVLLACQPQQPWFYQPQPQGFKATGQEDKKSAEEGDPGQQQQVVAEARAAGGDPGTSLSLEEALIRLQTALHERVHLWMLVNQQLADLQGQAPGDSAPAARLAAPPGVLLGPLGAPQVFLQPSPGMLPVAAAA